MGGRIFGEPFTPGICFDVTRDAIVLLHLWHIAYLPAPLVISRDT